MAAPVDPKGKAVAAAKLRPEARDLPIAGRVPGVVIAATDDYQIERLGGGRVRVTLDDGAQITIHEGTRASVIARCNIDGHPRFRAELAAALAGATLP